MCIFYYLTVDGMKKKLEVSLRPASEIYKDSESVRTRTIAVELEKEERNTLGKKRQTGSHSRRRRQNIKVLQLGAREKDKPDRGVGRGCGIGRKVMMRCFVHKAWDGREVIFGRKAMFPLEEKQEHERCVHKTKA